MADESNVSCIPQIGELAGKIWYILSENGPLSMAKVVKATEEPRDMVMLAIGWLAREDKVALEDQGRTRMVALRS